MEAGDLKRVGFILQVFVGIVFVIVLGVLLFLLVSSFVHDVEDFVNEGEVGGGNFGEEGLDSGNVGDEIIELNESDVQGMSLKELGEMKGIYVGGAVSSFSGELDERDYREIVSEEFSITTPTNEMKYLYNHPADERYEFGAGDKIVDFARERGLKVRGHILVFHNLVPSYLGGLSDEELESELEEHIREVVGHYYERFPEDVIYWDVVNEALSDCQEGGGYVLRSMNSCDEKKSIWSRVDDYVYKSFVFANSANPEAKLFYNEYGISLDNEGSRKKFHAMLEFLGELLDRGAPIDGVGFQMHISVEDDFSKSVLIQRFNELDERGLEVQITELDVRIKSDDGVSDEELEKQAEIYQSVMEACLEVDNCSAFVMWGFSDKYSWIPHKFEGYGNALIFDDDYEKKESYYALKEAFIS